jgi:hypothetical protein
MLEQLARDVTGWDASVVECFQRLATTQYMNHLRPTNVSTPDLRHWEPLDRLDTPFDRMAHTVDVRHIASGRGRYNIPHVGIFLWRLRSYALTDSPAFQVDARRYLFNPLGVRTPLFTRPEIEASISHLAEPLNVPMPISRRVLDATSSPIRSGQEHRPERCRRRSHHRRTAPTRINPANGNIPAGKIAIDPVLGRIATPLRSPHRRS